jgi:predicted PhzF superfamily epimerase YddE/YHI9
VRPITPNASLLTQAIAALGLQPRHVIAARLLENTPAWLGLLLDSTETVLQLNPNEQALTGLKCSVTVAAIELAPVATPLITRSNREARAFGTHSNRVIASAPDLAEIEVRAFPAGLGPQEGSVDEWLHISLAQWLIADGHVPRSYSASHGICLGRAARTFISQAANGQMSLRHEATS